MESEEEGVDLNADLETLSERRHEAGPSCPPNLRTDEGSKWRGEMSAKDPKRATASGTISKFEKFGQRAQRMPERSKVRRTSWKEIVDDALSRREPSPYQSSEEERDELPERKRYRGRRQMSRGATKRQTRPNEDKEDKDSVGEVTDTPSEDAEREDFAARAI